MKRSHIVVVIMVLTGVLLTGCLGGTGGPSIVSYTLTGSVVEADTQNPISGATVSLGAKECTTDQGGNFQFTALKSGEYTLEVQLSGYSAYQETISINKDSTSQIELTTNGPLVNISSLAGISDDGETEIDNAVFTIAGNINELLTGRGEINRLTTAITISELQAIVNGNVFTMEVEDNGDFEQPVPLDPGSNTIQLRVFDDAGNAGTSQILRVIVTLSRIDLRVILSWDSLGTDVDLHLFQRADDEPNVAADYDSWGDEERHVYYYNKTPNDFGDLPENNPVLDIDDTDGYGPETILLEEATPGYYHIWVHYYDSFAPYVGNIPSEATVNVIVNGGTDHVASYNFSKVLMEEWDVWYVGTIQMPSGNVIEVPPA